MTVIDRKMDRVSAGDTAARPSAVPGFFARYRVFEEIGTGSMGMVYAAEDPLIGRKVAIKQVRPDLAGGQHREIFRTRLRQEVRSAARCAHHGIVGILDFVDRDDAQYIVMEHVSGPSLQNLLSAGRLAQPEALEITLQLLAALEHAHARGIVHRDIKPANILVGEGSRVKLADFGVAWTELCEPSGAEVIFGTPSYMSPEQARGEKVDVRSDLFSVGMLLLRMLTGAPPYAGASFASVLRLLAAPDPVVVTGLEPSLQAMVEMAIAKEPAHRFQTAGAFARALREIVPADQDPVDLDSLPARAAQHEMTMGAAEEAASELPTAANETFVLPRVPSGDGAEAAPDRSLADLKPRIVAVLKEHIGPIADTLSGRLASRCATPEALVHALGQAIEHDATRRRFVAGARAVFNPDAVTPAAKPSRPRSGGRLSNAGAP